MSLLQVYTQPDIFLNHFLGWWDFKIDHSDKRQQLEIDFLKIVTL